jgi:hypothetical protein
MTPLLSPNSSFMKSSLAILLLLIAVPSVWAQQETPPATSEAGDVRMMVPDPVNVEGSSTAVGAELERSNYLRGGLQFEGAYSDNILPNGATPVGDASFAVSPFIALSLKRERLLWDLNYAPGYTFYRRYDSYDQSTQNLSTKMEYRFSPHVTLGLNDSLIKLPSFSDQFRPSAAGTVQQTPAVLIPTTLDSLNNSVAGQISYQFAPNAMIGVGGGDSELRYLDRTQLPGLFNSSGRSAQAFYTHRLSRKHYIGATYDFEDLLAQPIGTETQVHDGTFFYTFYFHPTASLSLFGGAEHSETQGGGLTPSQLWSPTAGGTFSWQGALTSFVVNASRKIQAGGGLNGAVRSYSADASLRHRFVSRWVAGVSGVYFNNEVLIANPLYSNGGHTLTGSASVQRDLTAHLGIEFGYTRLHQSYSGLPGISNNPDQNRGWAAISYQFERPLGR